MPALRTRNAALLFKIESVEGVEQAPSASTDGMLVEITGAPINYAPQITQTSEVTGSLDPRAPIVGGIQVTMSFAVYLKGNGTAGGAPEFGDLLRACGWGETLTAAAVPGAPAACTAGSTTTATLGAAASAVAQAYRGMPIDITGTPSGAVGLYFATDYTSGKVATLTDLAGAAIAATSNYQVLPNALYAPISASIPTGTAYLYTDGVLHKVIGCRGTFQLMAEAGGAGKLQFTLTGMYGGKSDAAVPSVTYDSTRPPIWKAGKMLVNRVAAALSRFQLDTGNDLIYPPDPNQTEGFSPTVITGRRITGALDPNATLVASGDILADLRNSTNRILHGRWGSTAGNRVAFTVPLAQFTAANPGDRQGLMTDEVSFFASGQDSGAFLCFY